MIDDKGRLFDADGNLNRWWTESAIEVFHQRASCLISQYGSYKINEIGGIAVDGITTQGENIGKIIRSRRSRVVKAKMDKNRIFNTIFHFWNKNDEKNYSKLHFLLADNGGIRASYRAYEKWLKNYCQTDECLNQEHLQGLNVTHKQLFFVNFAQVWCGAMRPEATKSKMKTAVHSPARYRVIGMIDYRNILKYFKLTIILWKNKNQFTGTLSNSREFAEAWNCSPDSAMNPPKKCSVWWYLIDSLYTHFSWIQRIFCSYSS